MSAKTNDAKLSFAVEDSLGTLPVTPDWVETDRISIDAWGSTLTKEEISPINQNAMNEKSIVTDLDSAVGYSNDLTFSGLKNHIQGVFRANLLAQDEFTPTATVASGFSHSALASGPLVSGTLIYSRNLANSDNNGLFIVDSGSTTTFTYVTTTLLAESSIADGARVNVVGVQGDAGDIEIDSDNNIISTTLDFTDLDLNVGQALWIGGSTSATTFANTDYTGLVRVKAIAANKITIEDRPWTVGAADDGATKTIQLFFGDFIRNVPRTDSDYNAESYTFELKYTGLEAGNPIVYEYPSGNRVNELTLNFPTATKASMSWSFIGQDTPVPTTSQASGNRLNTYDADGFSTSSDCVGLWIKDSSYVDYTTSFMDLNFTLSNNINPKKALCSLGAVDLNDGNFMVTGTVQAFMDDEAMLSAARTNETVRLDYTVDNGDGVIDFYIPSMTFGNATRDLPRDDNVALNFDIMSHKDSFYGFVMGMTFFHYLPV